MWDLKVGQSSNSVESFNSFVGFYRPSMKELTIRGFLDSREVFISIVLIFFIDSTSSSSSITHFL